MQVIKTNVFTHTAHTTYTYTHTHTQVLQGHKQPARFHFVRLFFFCVREHASPVLTPLLSFDNVFWERAEPKVRTEGESVFTYHLKPIKPLCTCTFWLIAHLFIAAYNYTSWLLLGTLELCLLLCVHNNNCARTKKSHYTFWIWSSFFRVYREGTMVQRLLTIDSMTNTMSSALQ